MLPRTEKTPRAPAESGMNAAPSPAPIIRVAPESRTIGVKAPAQPVQAAPDATPKDPTAIGPGNVPAAPDGLYTMPGDYFGAELGAFPDPMAYGVVPPYVAQPPPLAPRLAPFVRKVAAAAAAPKSKPSAAPVVLGLGALLYFL